ncbi:MAG: 30S ribosomal protein S16 [Candidatus Omnitrophica bacterium]|nr:30S ribosomal protein S16 [Candidatus Omnitrophota bacterium]MDD5591815.1 30S ribosomal protein S16 [Candidatus Omnitrophota bacterium]
MAVIIRLRRIGKNPKKRPHFRLSVFDERSGRDSKFIEEIGFYNPVSGATRINKERLEFWKKNGAQLSLTVKSLMKKQSVTQKEA